MEIRCNNLGLAIIFFTQASSSISNASICFIETHFTLSAYRVLDICFKKKTIREMQDDISNVGTHAR